MDLSKYELCFWVRSFAIIVCLALYWRLQNSSIARILTAIPLCPEIVLAVPEWCCKISDRTSAALSKTQETEPRLPHASVVCNCEIVLNSISPHLWHRKNDALHSQKIGCCKSCNVLVCFVIFTSLVSSPHLMTMHSGCSASYLFLSHKNLRSVLSKVAVSPVPLKIWVYTPTSFWQTLSITSWRACHPAETELLFCYSLRGTRILSDTVRHYTLPQARSGDYRWLLLCGNMVNLNLEVCRRNSCNAFPCRVSGAFPKWKDLATDGCCCKPDWSLVRQMMDRYVDKINSYLVPKSVDQSTASFQAIHYCIWRILLTRTKQIKFSYRADLQIES